MPREKITATSEPFHVKVGWSPVGHDVQVGVEADPLFPPGSPLPSPSLFQALLCDEETTRRLGVAARSLPDFTHPDEAGDKSLGRAILGLLDDVTGGYRGVWSHLDRQGCNNLIRVLRRARDAAFGRDE